MIDNSLRPVIRLAYSHPAGSEKRRTLLAKVQTASKAGVLTLLKSFGLQYVTLLYRNTRGDYVAKTHSDKLRAFKGGTFRGTSAYRERNTEVENQVQQDLSKAGFTIDSRPSGGFAFTATDGATKIGFLWQTYRTYAYDSESETFWLVLHYI